MEQKELDEKFMSRCLQLARYGILGVKQNPMVGAVIVSPEGRIIGEGYHVHFGEGHAEVNAFLSVKEKDINLLKDSTLYVNLEPCSHHGKTPPCTELIISKQIKRVVIGCMDPFKEVSGQGIKRLQEAGIDVTVGVLEKLSIELNRRFITFHTKRRPYVTLKWCQTSNGFLDDNFKPIALSTPFTYALNHKLRAENDAILVGRVTFERDTPRLNVRYWSGPDPLKIVLDKNAPFDKSINFDEPVIPQLFKYLYSRNIMSLIVEGGAETLKRFMENDLWWDEIRIEVSQKKVTQGTQAPKLPSNIRLVSKAKYDGNEIFIYRK